MGIIQSFQIKKRRKKAPSSTTDDLIRILLGGMYDTMATVDTLNTILVRKGLATPEDIEQSKQAVVASSTYKKINQWMENAAEHLCSELSDCSITDAELNQLLDILQTKEETKNE